MIQSKTAREMMYTWRGSHRAAFYSAASSGLVRDWPALLADCESINNGEDDFTFDFDGNEYRIIHADSIWEIYVEEIKNIVESCYDLKLDELPEFIAVKIDWEETAANAFNDGYGHTFSGYDGSEEEAAGYYIFRTN